MNTFHPNRAAAAAALALQFFQPLTAAAPQGDPQAPTFAPELVTAELIVTGDGTCAAEGRQWRARFDERGAGIEVEHPTTTSSSVTLRLNDYGRPGHVRAATQGAPQRSSATTLRYQHDGIVERYRIDSGGFEQSFVLHQRPAGRGDLVIGITATGNGLELPRKSAAHQALEFRHDGQRTVRYGEAIAFSRGGRPIEVATRCDGQGRIELIVPGAFLDRASYPVIVDPSVGPVILPGGLFVEDSAPDVAQDLRTGNYAFVWQRTFPSDTEIRARLYDRDGNPLTGVVAVSTSSLCRNPSVCVADMNPGFVQRRFFVVYEADRHLRMRRLSAIDLTPQGSEINLSSLSQGERHGNPCIAGDGRGSLLVAHDRTAPGANNPDQILLRYCYITSNGVANYGGPVEVLQTTTSGHVRRPRIARGLNRQLIGNEAWRVNRIVWERFYDLPAPGDYDIWTAAVRARSGTVVVTSPAAPVIGASIVGPNEIAPDIAMASASIDDGDPQFLVAWEDEGDVRAKRYSLAGAVGSVIDVRATSNYEGGPAVGGGACEFSVGYLEIVPPNEFAVNIRAARVLLDGTVPVSDRAVDVLNGPFQHQLRASSLPPSTTDYSDRAVNTVFFAWTGQTGGQFGLNDVRARRFDPVTANTSPFGSACSGPNGELPTIGINDQPLPGNGDVEFTISDAPPNSLAILLIGNVLTTTPVPGAPGCNLYLGLPALSIQTAVTDAAGNGATPLPIPCGFPPGTVLAFQWGVLTPGHNAVGWITSNDLDVSWAQ